MTRISVISAIILTTFTSCNINHLWYFQHLESPDGKYYYGLYSDFYIGAPWLFSIKIGKGYKSEKIKDKQ